MVIAFACGIGIRQMSPFHAVRPGTQCVLWSVRLRARAIAKPTLRDVDPSANATMSMTVTVFGREVVCPFCCTSSRAAVTYACKISIAAPANIAAPFYTAPPDASAMDLTPATAPLLSRRPVFGVWTALVRVAIWHDRSLGALPSLAGADTAE